MHPEKVCCTSTSPISVKGHLFMMTGDTLASDEATGLASVHGNLPQVGQRHRSQACSLPDTVHSFIPDTVHGNLHAQKVAKVCGSAPGEIIRPKPR